MTNYENEPCVTISLRRQPAGPEAGHPEGTVAYEVICRYCGDDLALDHQEVPAELRRIRGPYPVKDGIAAFLEHDESSTAEPARKRHEWTLVLMVRATEPLKLGRCVLR